MHLFYPLFAVKYGVEIIGFQIKIWRIGKYHLEIDCLIKNWIDYYDLFIFKNDHRNQFDTISLRRYWKSNSLMQSLIGDYKTFSELENLNRSDLLFL